MGCAPGKYAEQLIACFMSLAVSKFVNKCGFKVPLHVKPLQTSIKLVLRTNLSPFSFTILSDRLENNSSKN